MGNSLLKGVYFLCSREEQLLLEKEVSFKKATHDHGRGDIKIRKKKVSLGSRQEGKNSPNKTKKLVGSSEINVSQPERSKCDVCAAPGSVSYNKLLLCGRCPVKVMCIYMPAISVFGGVRILVQLVSD